jgi:hypothetical protein
VGFEGILKSVFCRKSVKIGMAQSLSDSLFDACTWELVFMKHLHLQSKFDGKGFLEETHGAL